MSVVFPHLSPKQVGARLASATAWLILMLASLVERFSADGDGRLLRTLARLAELETEGLIFLTALHRIEIRAPAERRARMRRVTRRPASAAPGFKLGKPRAAPLRRFVRGAGLRVRGDAAARLAHLRAVLANPDPYVRRVIKRIARGLVSARVVAVAPPDLLMAEALLAATAFVPLDTS